MQSFATDVHACNDRNSRFEEAVGLAAHSTEQVDRGDGEQRFAQGRHPHVGRALKIMRFNTVWQRMQRQVGAAG